VKRPGAGPAGIFRHSGEVQSRLVDHMQALQRSDLVRNVLRSRSIVTNWEDSVSCCCWLARHLREGEWLVGTLQSGVCVDRSDPVRGASGRPIGAQVGVPLFHKGGLSTWANVS